MMAQFCSLTLLHISSKEADREHNICRELRMVFYPLATDEGRDEDFSSPIRTEVIIIIINKDSC